MREEGCKASILCWVSVGVSLPTKRPICTSKLQQAGALVDVILTEHATAFVQPLTFSSLSHRAVYTNLWEPTGEAAARSISRLVSRPISW